MSIIVPYQGFGFGYRYLHGVLGPAILLAVQGFRHLARLDLRLRPLFLRATVLGLLVIAPLQAYMAHALYAPAATFDARISASGADYAIIGQDGPFAAALALNRADLANRPLRLLGDKIDDDLIATICRAGVRVAMPTGSLFAPIAQYFMIAPTGTADARFADLSPRLAAAGCTVQPLAGP